MNTGKTCAIFLLLTVFAASAAGVVPGWWNQDIGTTAGSATQNGDVITVTADGADIWGTSDQFHFVYKELRGDGTMTARLGDIPSGADSWAKAGLMIRDSLRADSRHAMMVITGGEGGGRAFQARGYESRTDSVSWHGNGFNDVSPGWLHLKREGNNFWGWYAPDGGEWEFVGGTLLDMTDPVYIGLCLTSRNPGTLLTVPFTNVSHEGDVNVNPDSLKAAESIPADGTNHTGTSVELWWTLASDATSHNVYFGTDLSAVTQGHIGALIATGSNLPVIVGMPGSAYPFELESEATYYWRVDVMSIAGISQGDVWSFAVAEPEACPQEGRIVELLGIKDIVPPASLVGNGQPTQHPAGWAWLREVPDQAQKICSVHFLLLELDQAAINRVFGELFPPGQGANGLTLRSSEGMEPLPGRYLLGIAQYEADIPLNDTTSMYIYTCGMDSDGLNSNNYQPLPNWPHDFYKDIDKAYEIKKSFSDPWRLELRENQQNSFVTENTNAIGIISGSEMAYFIPVDEIGALASATQQIGPLVRTENVAANFITTLNLILTSHKHLGDYGVHGLPNSMDICRRFAEHLSGYFGLTDASVPVKVPVPEIRGLTQNDAVTTIVNSKLVTGNFIQKKYDPFVPAGEVITQWPAPGTMVDPGSVVEMTVSRGPAPDATQAKVNLNGQGILSGELGAKGVPLGEVLPLVINYGQPMANVKISVDGQTIPFEAKPLDTSLLGWWLNLSGLQVGEHDLVIEAFDESGTTVSTFQSGIFVQELKADVRLNGRRIETGLNGSKGVPFGDPLPVLIDYPLDVANVRISIDGQSIPFEANPLRGSLKNWWLNLSGFPVGNHDVLIEAFDGQGQKVSTFESPINILDVESTVRIGGRQIASGEAGGKGVPFGIVVPVVMDFAQPVANVRISVDGGIPLEVKPFGLDLIGWWFNLSELSVGDHNIKIEAFDGTGTSVSTFESQIFVEEVGSEVHINDRLIASGLDGNKGVPFSDPMQVVVEYDHPVSNVRVSLDGQGIPFEATPVTSGDLTRWFINLSGVEVGNHELVIEAISSGGRTVSLFESPLAVQDVESEVMINGRKIASGLDGNKGISFSDPMQVVVNYASPTANVRISIDGSLPLELTPVGTDLKQWFVNLSGVEVGEHRVVIEAFDGLGKKLTVFDTPVFVQQIESQVTINGKEIATGLDGDKSVSYGDVIPIVVDYAQPVANVRIRVDGWPVIEAMPVGSNLKRFFVNWASLPTGNHRVEIEAFDGQGKKVSAFESDISIVP